MSADAEILYNLALAYYGKKEYKNCVFYLKKIMDGNSASPRVKRLFDAATGKLVKEHVQSVVSDDKEPFLKKLFLRVKSIFFDAGLVQAVQANAVAEARENIRDQKLSRDSLTGALNPYAFKNFIPGFYVQKKPELSLYLVMVDVDFFKAFNDCYGHEIGNLVLKALASIGDHHFPGRFFRYGGEEFAWCYETSDEGELARKADDFRKDIEQKVKPQVNEQIKTVGTFRYPTNDEIESRRGELILLGNPVTISQGAAIYGTDGSSLDEVVKVADGCLYIAKDRGRNCVVVRSEVKFKGKSPDKYTREMLKLLDLIAVSRKAGTWWDLAPKLNDEERSVMIDNARLQSEGKA